MVSSLAAKRIQMSFQLPPPGQEKLITSADELWVPLAPNEEAPLSPVPEEDEVAGKVEAKEERKTGTDKPKPQPENLADKV